MSGPFNTSPFDTFMISPLMTAPNIPRSRCAVFDASIGHFLLNSNTPDKSYAFDEYVFSFPKIDDLSNLILSLERGGYLLKHDLSRFYLQLPLDPAEYNKVCVVWHSQIFFFTSLVWDCCHACMSGQRVSDANALIHHNIGLDKFFSPFSLSLVSITLCSIYRITATILEPVKQLKRELNCHSIFLVCSLRL